MIRYDRDRGDRGREGYVAPQPEYYYAPERHQGINLFFVL
jgi:hypothetical protein